MMANGIVVGIFIIILIFGAKETLSGAPEMELLHTQDKSDNLLKNWDFERKT